MNRDDSTNLLTGVRDGNRRLFLQSMGVAGLGLAAGTTAANADDESDEGSDGGAEEDDGERTAIDSPTVIDEPGEYELVTDLSPDHLEEPGCIVVESEGVTLYGNDHTIDLRETSHPGETDWRRHKPDCVAINPDLTHEDGAGVGWETAIENLTVVGGYTGISTAWGGAGEFTNILVRENRTGIAFSMDTGTVTNSVFRGNGAGLNLGGNEIWGGSTVTVEECTFEQNGSGIRLGVAADGMVTRTRIVENGKGVFSYGWDATGTIKESHICGNQTFGIEAGVMEEGTGDYEPPDDYEPPTGEQPYIDARDVYWGAANGPGSFGNPEEPFTDPETGQAADGDGDVVSQSLEPGVSNVRFDPFHEAPIADIGADR